MKRTILSTYLLLLSFAWGCATRDVTDRVLPPEKGREFPELDPEAVARYKQEAASVAVTFPEPWTERQITVLRPSGTPIVVTASWTMAKVRQNDEMQDWPLLAFVCQDTGKTWIGPVFPCYVETPEGLYGIKIAAMFYAVVWYESRVVKENDFKLPLFDDLFRRFQKEAAYYYVIRNRPYILYDCSFSHGDFYIRLPEDSIKVTQATFSHSNLNLMATNSYLNDSLDITIDTTAREIIRCWQGGRLLYPQSK